MHIQHGQTHTRTNTHSAWPDIHTHNTRTHSVFGFNSRTIKLVDLSLTAGLAVGPLN